METLWINDQPKVMNSLDGCGNELNYRPYESTRGLHHYEFEVYFSGLGFISRFYRIADL